MAKAIHFVILFCGLVSIYGLPTNSDDDTKARQDIRTAMKWLKVPNTLEKTKEVDKREVYLPQDHAFQSYLNAFAMNVMSQAYGLNGNMFNGYSGAYFYPPYGNSNPYMNMYPQSPVIMPPYTSQMEAIKRTLIPPVPPLLPHGNYFHSQPFQNLIQNSLRMKKEEPAPYVSHFISDADPEKKLYVENLLHTPLKELVKKHDIALKKKKRLRETSRQKKSETWRPKKLETQNEDDLESLIRELGEFNNTAKKGGVTTKPVRKDIQSDMDGFQEDVEDVNEASLTSDSDGTSVFRYLVHTKPNTAIVNKSDTKLSMKRRRSPVDTLIEALKRKVRFEKDLIKTFVNYVCDKECLN